jgi:UDP-N-acetylglucosamine--N-acetylmuramyl-(pentapeptide) pyrophosphoryl-undecaprenol N-acetylglucosamine transferase
MQPMRVVIAGGGTGGHLYPGIALAEEILGRGGNEVLFVGTQRGLEAKVLPKQGYTLETIDVSGLKRTGAAGLMRGLGRLPGAYLQSRRILRRFTPDLVVGVGGYSSGPMVLAAALARIPTAILEQNSIPGLTNRMLSRLARRAFIAFDASRRYFPRKKTVLAGNPIRARLRATAPTPGARPTLLVVGGSQGAHALNELMMSAAPRLSGVRIVHQTGEADLAAVASAYQAAGVDADARPFIEDMAAVYASADLCVCRAGATTIAELTAVGLPAVFIPFPGAADDHQFWNAQALAEAGAARVHRQGSIDGVMLADEIVALLADPAARARMAAQMRTLGRPDAARAIVDQLEQMVR